MQFKKILRNKKTARFFTEQETNAMRHVAQAKGPKLTRALAAVQDWGVKPSTLFTAGGVATASLGAPAAGTAMILIPVIGGVSKKLANRLLLKNAHFADQIIRAGKDAKKIADVYIRSTPKARRSATELAELLARPNIDLNIPPTTPFLQEAFNLAKSGRAAIALPAVTQNLSQQEF